MRIIERNPRPRPRPSPSDRDRDAVWLVFRLVELVVGLMLPVEMTLGIVLEGRVELVLVKAFPTEVVLAIVLELLEATEAGLVKVRIPASIVITSF